MTNLENKTGLKLNHIPYRGAVDSSRALLAGDVDIMVDAVSGFSEFAKTGRARILMGWEPQRHPNFPDVPTATELGLGIAQQSTFGIVGPKGMAPEVVDMLNAAFRSAMQDPDYQKLVQELNQVIWYQTPADYTEYARKMFKAERALVERAGLLAE